MKTYVVEYSTVEDLERFKDEYQTDDLHEAVAVAATIAHKMKEDGFQALVNVKLAYTGVVVLSSVEIMKEVNKISAARRKVPLR